jgi:lysozyme family protein
VKGKFVQDGRFDPEAVSKQCGAALMLKAVAG